MVLRKKLPVRQWRISESYKDPSTREFERGCEVNIVTPQSILALSVIWHRWGLPRNRRSERLAQKGLALEPTQTLFLTPVPLPLQDCVPYSLRRIEPAPLQTMSSFISCKGAVQSLNRSSALHMESNYFSRLRRGCFIESRKQMYYPTLSAACG